VWGERREDCWSGGVRGERGQDYGGNGCGCGVRRERSENDWSREGREGREVGVVARECGEGGEKGVVEGGEWQGCAG
jgi:hypothetical protein